MNDSCVCEATTARTSFGRYFPVAAVDVGVDVCASGVKELADDLRVLGSCAGRRGRGGERAWQVELNNSRGTAGPGHRRARTDAVLVEVRDEVPRHLGRRGGGEVPDRAAPRADERDRERRRLLGRQGEVDVGHDLGARGRVAGVFCARRAAGRWRQAGGAGLACVCSSAPPTHGWWAQSRRGRRAAATGARGVSLAAWASSQTWGSAASPAYRRADNNWG